MGVCVLQHCFSSLMFKVFVFAQLSCHSISLGLRSGHSNSSILYFFSHSDVVFLVCMGHCCFCMTRLSCWTEGLTLVSRIFWYMVEIIIVSMTVSFPGPVTAKQAQIITSPPCFTVGMRCLWWYAVFCYHQTWCCAWRLFQKKNSYLLIIKEKQTMVDMSRPLLICIENTLIR